MAAETSFVNQVHGLSRGYCEVKKGKVDWRGERGRVVDTEVETSMGTVLVVSQATGDCVSISR